MIRRGYCEKHNQWSSQFTGTDVHGWQFRCGAKPSHMPHFFYVKPDPTAPQAVAQIEAWKEAQRLEQLTEEKLRHAGQ